MSRDIFALVVVPGIMLAIAAGGYGIVVLLTRKNFHSDHPAE